MNDLAITLDSSSTKHLYEQIYEYIRQEIREEKLGFEEKLPSTRALAEYLQVSRSTVDLAYEQLLSEGYIEARPYKGFFVCKIEELYSLKESENSHPAEKKTPGHKPLYDFSPNGVELNSFPFGTWKKITKNTLIDERKEMFALGHPQGDEELRSTISRYLHASRGVNCEPDQIIVGAGNDYLLLLLEKIFNKKRKIAIENPTYLRAYKIFQSFSYQVEPIEMDESGMRVDLLEASGASLAYIMPSHQYPTGIVMPIGRRLELLKWAIKEEDRYLIEDDYDSEFRYRGKPIPALQASDKSERVIYIGTFSKAIAPAIRVSYMVLPGKLLKLYRETCSFYSSTVSRIDQSVINEFIREGFFERHLNKMRKIYKGRHDCLLSACRMLPDCFTVSGENAGLHLILEYHGNKTEQQLIREAGSAGIKVYGLSETFAGKLPTNWKPAILLGYAGMQEEKISEGISKLAVLWKE